MINIGIVGLGKMGISHCALIGAHPNANLTAVCDTSGLTIDAFRKYTKTNCYSNYDKMLSREKLDAVFIATPTKFHTDMVSKAIDIDLNVFCEKPFTLSADEGKSLIEKADSASIVNQVGYHRRFIATFQEVKKLITNGVLGKLYHFVAEAYGPVVLRPQGKSWRSTSAAGGGCLADYASHVVNLVQYILGEPKSVCGTCLKRIYSSNVEDAVYSTLHLENELSGILSVNWSDETNRKMAVQITVEGTDGKIVSDAQELKIYLKQERSDLGFGKGWNIRYITDLVKHEWYYLRGEEFSAQTDYFIQQCQHSSRDNLNSFKNALKTDYVLEMLRKNAGEEPNG
jgi:predicted dehydrogenase